MLIIDAVGTGDAVIIAAFLVLDGFGGVVLEQELLSPVIFVEIPIHLSNEG